MVTVNGEAVPVELDQGYVTIDRRWQATDEVVLDLPMPVRTVAAHENVEADRGRLALQRGPLVYCVEWLDSETGNVSDLFLEPGHGFDSEYRSDLLGGIQVVRGEAGSRSFEAIPYFAWAHRGQGGMAVWLPVAER